MQSTVAVCQLELEELAVETNLATVRKRVECLDDDVDLAVFPEHTLTGFVADGRIEAVALARDSEPIEELRSLADRRDVAPVSYTHLTLPTIYSV